MGLGNDSVTVAAVLSSKSPMKRQYDFSKSKKNPYSRMLKTQITIRIDRETIDYFKQLATDSGISDQNLINMYLRECVETRKTPQLRWA